MNQLNFSFITSWIFFPIIIWIIFWKGYALWIAVKNNHKIWFVVILVLNTFGILEIIYIFYVAKKKWSDLKEVLTGSISSKKKSILPQDNSKDNKKEDKIAE